MDIGILTLVFGGLALLVYAVWSFVISVIDHDEDKAERLGKHRWGSHGRC